MPRNAAPLTPDQIGTIRRWIAEGAKVDAADPPEYRLAIPKVRAGKFLRIECSTPVAGYLILDVIGSGRVLLEQRAAVKSPGKPVVWTIWREKAWPARLSVELSILYTETDPLGASLRVTSGRRSMATNTRE